MGLFCCTAVAFVSLVYLSRDYPREIEGVHAMESPGTSSESVCALACPSISSSPDHLYCQINMLFGLYSAILCLALLYKHVNFIKHVTSKC